MSELDEELAAMGPLSADKLSEWLPDLLEMSMDPRLEHLKAEAYLVEAVIIRLGNGQLMRIDVKEISDSDLPPRVRERYMA